MTMIRVPRDGPRGLTPQADDLPSWRLPVNYAEQRFLFTVAIAAGVLLIVLLMWLYRRRQRIGSGIIGGLALAERGRRRAGSAAQEIKRKVQERADGH